MLTWVGLMVLKTDTGITGQSVFIERSTGTFHSYLYSGLRFYVFHLAWDSIAFDCGRDLARAAIL